MALRAVIFDYGMVLTGPQDPEAYAALTRITGLAPARFESLYWANRHAYDEGALSGLAFWQKFLHDAGLPQDQEKAQDLNQWDARMWTTQNRAMLAWQLDLRQRGLRTAILSNMGDNVLDRMKREFDWLPRFDVLVWSYRLRMTKPDPAIYRYTLKELGAQPGETLFIDDKQVNVEAARTLGMTALEFSTVERLRSDLVAAGLDADLPLPA